MARRADRGHGGDGTVRHRAALPQPGIFIILERLPAIGREGGEIHERQQRDKGSDCNSCGNDKGRHDPINAAPGRALP